MATERRQRQSPLFVCSTVSKEVPNEDRIKFQPLCFENCHSEAAVKLFWQAALGFLCANEDNLGGAKLNLRVLLVAADNHDGRRLRPRLGEKNGLGATKVSCLTRELVERHREELFEKVNDASCQREDAIVRAVVQSHRLHLRHLNLLQRAGRLSKLDMLKENLEILEPEPHSARDGLARVPAEEHVGLASAHLDEDPQLRLGEVLRLVNVHAVQLHARVGCLSKLREDVPTHVGYIVVA
mmetsp:Transcript_2716/g.6076  ORF Transcript_2716/g.6076 Transcript_2716/m.6076 type:complete len:240 (-) Transcript_2716:279-998(-)